MQLLSGAVKYQSQTLKLGQLTDRHMGIANCLSNSLPNVFNLIVYAAWLPIIYLCTGTLQLTITHAIPVKKNPEPDH